MVIGGATTLASASWHHYNAHIHSRDAFWVLKVLDSHFHAHIVQILTQKRHMTRKDTPFSVLLWFA